MAKTNVPLVIFLLLAGLAGLAYYGHSAGWFATGYWQNTGANANQGTANTGQHTVTIGSYPVRTVELQVVDKLNPKAGVPNITVEVIGPIKGTESAQELANMASNPMRRVVDSGDTDADGRVTFSGGRIKTNKYYMYAVRGDSEIYDKIFTYEIKHPKGITGVVDHWSIDQYIEVYQVGEFANISSSNTMQISLSGLSGPQYVTFDIDIGETEPGKVLKDPVLVIRSPEEAKIKSGGIRSIYLVKKSGSNLLPPEIASSDLVNWIDVSPIQLQGTVPSDDGHVYMGVQDSATYTVKLTFDADVVQPGQKLQFILDDLSKYGGQDEVTRDTKADPQILTIEFTS